MRMLRWILGLTLRDRKRNDDIRRILGVACIMDKVRETMLRWYYWMYNGQKRMIVSNGSWRQMYRIYSRINRPLKIESVCGPKSLTHISRRWFLRTCTGCKLCSTEACYCVHLPLSTALSWPTLKLRAALRGRGRCRWRDHWCVTDTTYQWRATQVSYGNPTVNTTQKDALSCHVALHVGDCVFRRLEKILYFMTRV